MIQTIKQVKINFRDQYHFKPSRVEFGEPCFDNIPDGTYPMVLDGDDWNVTVKDGRLILDEAV